MTRTTLLRVLRLPRPHPPGPPHRPASVFARRRGAAPSLLVGVVGLLVVHAVALVLLDSAYPQLRDPEYGRRAAALRARLAEHPGRPLVLVVGSSRTCMGLSPAAWEEARPGGADPLLFNMGLVGGGPVIELLALRRAYADGFRPDAVVIEFWPPFLREDGPFHEPDRIDHVRLFPGDAPLVRDYFPDPAATEAKMRRDRFHPLYETRHHLLAQLAPRWQPWDRRMDLAWGGLDGWGWLPGLDEYPAKPADRAKRLAHCEPIYRGQFAGYTVHPLADRALRESVALARARGAKVALAYLPESSEFRGWMPPGVERAAQDYLARLRRELDVPVIDARLWMDDGFLVDGFHLSRRGAAEFTRRFGPATTAAFGPNEGRE